MQFCECNILRGVRSVRICSKASLGTVLLRVLAHRTKRTEQSSYCLNNLHACDLFLHIVDILVHQSIEMFHRPFFSFGCVIHHLRILLLSPVLSFHLSGSSVSCLHVSDRVCVSVYPSLCLFGSRKNMMMTLMKKNLQCASIPSMSPMPMTISQAHVSLTSTKKKNPLKKISHSFRPHFVPALHRLPQIPFAAR